MEVRGKGEKDGEVDGVNDNKRTDRLQELPTPLWQPRLKVHSNRLLSKSVEEGDHMVDLILCHSRMTRQTELLAMY